VSAIFAARVVYQRRENFGFRGIAQFTLLFKTRISSNASSTYATGRTQTNLKNKLPKEDNREEEAS